MQVLSRFHNWDNRFTLRNGILVFQNQRQYPRMSSPLSSSYHRTAHFSPSPFPVTSTTTRISSTSEKEVPKQIYLINFENTYLLDFTIPKLCITILLPIATLFLCVLVNFGSQTLLPDLRADQLIFVLDRPIQIRLSVDLVVDTFEFLLKFLLLRLTIL